MNMLIIIGFVIIATISVFGVIDIIRQINKIPSDDEN
jgi:hypothetical protein